MAITEVTDRQMPGEGHRGMYVSIADKVLRNPECLGIALDNIDRWLAQGHSAPHRLEQWRGILLDATGSEEGMTRLQLLLREPSELSRHLLSFAPFPGVLTPEERRPHVCTYKH